MCGVLQQQSDLINEVVLNKSLKQLQQIYPIWKESI